jgi:hypothetical protein
MLHGVKWLPPKTPAYRRNKDEGESYQCPRNDESRPSPFSYSAAIAFRRAFPEPSWWNFNLSMVKK